MVDMSKRKHKMTDDEIEADVLAKLDDPSAWEQPIYVAPRRAPRPAWVAVGRHLELAAKFQVLATLHRLGVEANLTLAQPNNIDITVILPSGQAITIDVKTLAGTDKWSVDHFTGRKHHYIAFVAYPEVDDPLAPPLVQVVPSDALEEFLRQRMPTTLSVDALAEHLHIDDPWKHLISGAAA